MDLTKKLMSVLVLLVCVLIALNNQRAAPHSRSLHRNLVAVGDDSSVGGEEDAGLKYDYYRNSCPSADNIVRTAVRELHAAKNTVGPQLVRLAFHDCFVIAGGQFYPVLTRRRDSKRAFPRKAVREIPGPDFNQSQAVHSFAVKGFNPREMMALLGGGHSTGQVHCNFILNRLFNFEGTGKPDPTIDADFLKVLRSECSHPASSPSHLPSTEASDASFENRAMQMDYEGAGNSFGEVYYRSLLRGKGLLISDQQLMTHDNTKAWVERYASDIDQFRWDFGHAMFKLTHLRDDDSKEGEVRLNCRRVN